MGEFLVTQGAKSNADEHFYKPLSFFERHPHFIEMSLLFGPFALFILSGCFCVYRIARLMFAKKEHRHKYAVMIILSIFGAFIFYSFFKMIGEGLSV